MAGLIEKIENALYPEWEKELKPLEERCITVKVFFKKTKDGKGQHLKIYDVELYNSLGENIKRVDVDKSTVYNTYSPPVFAFDNGITDLDDGSKFVIVYSGTCIFQKPKKHTFVLQNNHWDELLEDAK